MPDFIEPLYTSHAILALKSLGGADPPVVQNPIRFSDGTFFGPGGPDIFYLEAGNWPGGAYEPSLVRSWLGYDWQGRFIVHLTKPCPAPDYCHDRISLATAQQMPELARWVMEEGKESGMEWIDEAHLAYAFLHDQEYDMAKSSSQVEFFIPFTRHDKLAVAIEHFVTRFVVVLLGAILTACNTL